MPLMNRGRYVVPHGNFRCCICDGQAENVGYHETETSGEDEDWLTIVGEGVNWVCLSCALSNWLDLWDDGVSLLRRAGFRVRRDFLPSCPKEGDPRDGYYHSGTYHLRRRFTKGPNA